MVLLWIAVGIGILIAVILIAKLIRTPPHAALSMEQRCKKCGKKIIGQKCPRCDKRFSFGV